MREAVTEVVTRVRRNRSIRARILNGINGHFCYGGGLRNIATMGLNNQGWRNRLQDLLMLDRTVIAAVEGAASGAGFSIVLVADFVLVTQRGKFCITFMKVGLVPDCGAYYLSPHIVGVQSVNELMLPARDLDGAESLKLGLVMELHAPEQLLLHAQALAASFIHASLVAASLVKRKLAALGADLPSLLEQEANALAIGNAYHRATESRFVNKEPAFFQSPALL